MTKNTFSPAGPEAQYGPRLAGAVLHNYLENSDEPLAVACRRRLFRNVFPHTELAVDLKLLTRKPGRMHVDEYLNGMITRDGDDHYCFIEKCSGLVTKRRNPHVFEGEFITITRRADGLLRLNFRAMPQGWQQDIDSYAYGVAWELRTALRDLVED